MKIAIAAFVIGCAFFALNQCAHAQQGSWPIPRSAYSTVRASDPVVKVCPDTPMIRTLVDVDRIESAIRARGGRLCE